MTADSGYYPFFRLFICFIFLIDFTGLLTDLLLADNSLSSGPFSAETIERQLNFSFFAAVFLPALLILVIFLVYNYLYCSCRPGFFSFSLPKLTLLFFLAAATAGRMVLLPALMLETIDFFLLTGTRDRWLEIINVGYSPGRASLIAALILGQRQDIFRYTVLFRRAGVSHLLALSGLHAGFVAVIINFSLAKLPAVGAHSWWLSSLFLAGYVLLAGASPSLQRAGIMLISWFILKRQGRSTSPLNILGLAGILILLLNPDYLYQLNFQLSFLVVLALIFYLPFLQRKFSGPLAISLAATLGSAPLLAFHFGEVNLNALISNLILIPQVAVIICLNLLMILAGYFSPALAGLLAELGNLLLTPFLFSTALLAGLPFRFSWTWQPAPEKLLFYRFGFLPLPLLLFYLLLFILPEGPVKTGIPVWIASRHRISRRQLIFLLVLMLFFTVSLLFIS